MAPGYVVCFFYWLLSAAIQFCKLMADDRSPHLKCIFRCLLSMTFLGWGISMPWLRWCDVQAHMKYSDLLLMAILHYEGPLNMTITNTAIVYFFSRQQAEDEESRHQEAMMQFHSVRSARCSCPHDEQRIRLAIEGSEEEVDKVIGILVKAGAYTDQLREAYEMGSWFRNTKFTCFIRVSSVSNFNPSLPQMMIPMEFQHVTMLHLLPMCFEHVFSACQEMICKVQAIPICCPAVWLQCWDGPLLRQIPSRTPCWYRKWSSAECGSAMAFWCWRPFVAGMVLCIYIYIYGYIYIYIVRVCFYGGFSWLHRLWWFLMRSDHSHHSLESYSFKVS